MRNAGGGLVVLTCLAVIAMPNAGAADKAAEDLARKSGCFKCHAIDKEKVAPAYRAIAAKLKSDPEAEQKLFVHLTTHPTVKVDGEDETHTSLKTDSDDDVRRVVRWILSF